MSLGFSIQSFERSYPGGVSTGTVRDHVPQLSQPPFQSLTSTSYGYGLGSLPWTAGQPHRQDASFNFYDYNQQTPVSSQAQQFNQHDTSFNYYGHNQQTADSSANNDQQTPESSVDREESPEARMRTIDHVAEALKDPDRQILALPQDDFPLRLNSVDEAIKLVFRRIQLSVKEDDVEEVEENLEFYLRRIMRAMVSLTYKGPDGVKGKGGAPLSQAEIQEWHRWQRQKLIVVHEVLSIPFVRDSIEARARILLHDVLNTHRLGYRLMNLAQDDDTKLKCSSRMEAVIAAINDYAIIRSDVLNDPAYLERLAETPKGYVIRVTSNRKTNHEKKTRLGGSKAIRNSRSAAVTGSDDENDFLGLDAASPDFSHASYNRMFTSEEIAKFRKAFKDRAKRQSSEIPAPTDNRSSVAAPDEDEDALYSSGDGQEQAVVTQAQSDAVLGDGNREQVMRADPFLHTQFVNPASLMLPPRKRMKLTEGPEDII